jgi:hypothetical protein
MDGEVEVHLVKLEGDQMVPAEDKNGAVLVHGDPQGQKMGWMRLKRGHQGLLPKNCAYQFRNSGQPGVIADLHGRVVGREVGGNLPNDALSRTNLRRSMH